LKYFLSPKYEANFSVDRKRINSALLAMEKKQKKIFHSPYKNSKLDIQTKF